MIERADNVVSLHDWLQQIIPLARIKIKKSRRKKVDLHLKLVRALLALGLMLGLAGPAMATQQEPSVTVTSAPARLMQQPGIWQSYGLTAKQLSSVVVDSNLTDDQAIGDSVVPPEDQALHAAIRPYLRVVWVIHWGFDDRIHVGQLVVHQALAGDMQRIFAGMFLLRFPITSVIPESQFGYVDDRSMLANNTSSYRPDRINGHPSDHFRGIAIDVNPRLNPMIVTQDGVTTVDPPGATYNPAVRGTIVKNDPVHRLWKTLLPGRAYGWGGNWGDPAADPPYEFYMKDYFDYQHFYPNDSWYDSVPLPAGF